MNDSFSPETSLTGVSTSSSSSSEGRSGAVQSSFVQVGVRIAPTGNKDSYLEVSDHGNRARIGVKVVGNSPARAYTVDRVFGKSEPQSSVFAFVAPASLRVLQGESVSIMALGQTGTGKTHTVFGTKTDKGLLPRIANTFLQRTSIAVSMFQIYDDKVYDLLANPGTPVRHSQPEKFDSQAVSKHEIDSITEFSRLVASAVKHRRTTATQVNPNSSRSHAFVIVETKTGGRMVLVDLAGGERLKLVASKEHSTRESIATNSSLSSVYKVLDELSKGRAHISHRETVLTAALQPVWSESAHVYIIACVSGDPARAGETCFTLKYAKRAREIKTVAGRSIGPPESLAGIFADVSAPMLPSSQPVPVPVLPSSHSTPAPMLPSAQSAPAIMLPASQPVPAPAPPLFQLAAAAPSSSPPRSSKRDPDAGMKPLQLSSPARSRHPKKQAASFRKLRPTSVELERYRRCFLDARYSPIFIDDDGAVVYDQKQLNPVKNRRDANLLGYLAHFANYKAPDEEDFDELYTAWLLSNAQPRENRDFRSLLATLLALVVFMLCIYWDYGDTIYAGLDDLWRSSSFAHPGDAGTGFSEWTSTSPAEIRSDPLEPFRMVVSYAMVALDATWTHLARVWQYLAAWAAGMFR